MPIVRELITEQDFQDAMDRHLRIRVFQNDQLIDTGGIIIRFTDDTIITQSGVDDLTYHSRRDCQFYELRK